MKAQAYDHLAEWFEYLNDDCDYPKWSQYFIDTLSRLQTGKKGLELGCGSGAFCRSLARCGFYMSGADRSEAMLSVAEKRAREEGLLISFFKADAAALKTPEKYDFILSPNDCFNYIPPEKILRAFKNVRNSLQIGGIFLFDVSSEYKLRKKVADTVSVDDRDDVTYLSFNKLFENQIEMDVTLFVKDKNGSYIRFDERHLQYIHTEAFLVSALREAKFEILGIEGKLGEEKEGSDRLNFICKR